MTRIRDLPEPIADAVEAGLSATRAFRVYTDQTIAEVARAASIDPHRLARIEVGSPLTDEEAEALGLALDVPPDLPIQEGRAIWLSAVVRFTAQQSDEAA